MELITKFLSEALKRFTAETPWFFKVIRNISIVTTLITGIPSLLTFLTESGVTLPEIVFVLANKTVAISSIVAGFISQLTVTSGDKKYLGIKDTLTIKK